MTPADAEAVLAIYQDGIDDGDATFESAAPTWAEFDAGHLEAHRLVAIDPVGSLLGWVVASAVSSRPVYRGVVEHSLYVARSARGQGVGRTLLAAFIDSSAAAGIWTIQAGVFPENTASLALHAAAGFRVVGVRERLGLHDGRWRDVVLLERRA
jgi:L-amino acid N-acyltransferase YncA